MIMERGGDAPAGSQRFFLDLLSVAPSFSVCIIEHASSSMVMLTQTSWNRGVPKLSLFLASVDLDTSRVKCLMVQGSCS